MYIGHIVEEKPLDIGQFNPNHIADFAEAYLAKLERPRQRQILQNFIDHARAEANGNYQALMDSCSPGRQDYAVYGAAEAFQAAQPQSFAALEQHYRGLIEMNLYLIHFEPEKLIVGEDELVIEGVVHQLYSGELLQAVHNIDIDDPQAVYMLSKKTCVFFTFDAEGKGCGEQAYSNGPATAADIVKLAPEQVPAQFYRNPVREGGG